LTRGAPRAILPAFQMVRLAAALVLAVALSACGTSPCQELGQRICACQPGLPSSTCKTQVEQQLKNANPGEGKCDQLLQSCQPPAGVDLCEWMLTEAGKRACGLTPQ
jgi:hypothetical protein